MKYPVGFAAELGDECSESRRMDLTGPVRVSQVVVEGVAGGAIGVLVVDKDHHPFRHRCSPELKAPPVRTPEGSDGGEYS